MVSMKIGKWQHNLTVRGQQFVLNMMAGMPAGEAYLAAGYKSKGDPGRAAALLLRSNNMIKSYYYEMLEKREREALSAVQKVREEWAEKIMPADEVKARLSEIARAEIGDCIDPETGELKPGVKVPYAVKEYSNKTTTDTKGTVRYNRAIKLEDRIAALQELSKIHGLYAPSKHLHGRIQFDISIQPKNVKNEVNEIEVTEPEYMIEEAQEYEQEAVEVE